MGRYGWASRAGSITAVAGTGAFIGWAISRDADWAIAASRSECAQAHEQICIGVAPVAGLAFGITLTVASCWVIMAVAGVRPLGLTVPAAITLIILATVTWPVPGGRLHPAWQFSLVTAAELALVAIAATWAREMRHRADASRAEWS
jgi:hypothetical protein